jgi:hypothetical protein
LRARAATNNSADTGNVWVCDSTLAFNSLRTDPAHGIDEFMKIRQPQWRKR